MTVCQDLADWASALVPTEADVALAQRALVDTVAVTLAGHAHPLAAVAAGMPEGPRWATVGHVLDFDDLHMESTTHISVVCVPAVLAARGDARAYLAAAGVMARLGNALGWEHYSAGWHATCTAGAPAAAVGAAVAWGLGPDRIATALALAVPGAGGVQRAFGTDAKALQVGFAVDAGLRAARLAAAGASADPRALEVWLELVGGSPSALDHTALDHTGPVVPGGLATKLYPCCYALQRPISALRELAPRLDPDEVARIVLRTPEATLTPLIHPRPQTGLEGKFSLEYAAAAALLDGYPGFASFTDDAVRRPQARRLVELVEVELTPGGDWLLDGELLAQVHLRDGEVLRASRQFPPGSPQHPATGDQVRAKLDDCLVGVDTDPARWTWANAVEVLRGHLDGAG